jgi:hypothetical protein
MNLSDKLCVPSLQKACLDFLLSHAAGKPIKAMRIAEIFGHEELYRESSRSASAFHSTGVMSLT